MGFKLKIYNSMGNEVPYTEMDKIVCNLWGTNEDNVHWAYPHGKKHVNNWSEFLGLACMAIDRSGVIKAVDLLEPIVRYTNYFELDDLDNKLEENKFELKLLLYWIQEGYWFIKS